MDPIVSLDSMQQIAQGIDHAEGICLTSGGALYVSGEKGQIYRVEDDGTADEVTSTGGWTLGLASDAEARIYACDPVRRAVLRWTPGSSDAPVVWTEGAPDAPLRTPNWGAFGPDGSYYLSDSGGWKARDGRILVVREGRASAWSAESVDFPNGLAVSPDGRELWVLESTPGRLVAFDIRADGSPGPRRLVSDLSGTVPDGIAFAADGSVVIACYRPDIILQRTADGSVLTLGHDPEGTVLAAPTNCVFMGEGLRVIAVPNIGRWHVTRFTVPGLAGVPLFYPTREQLGG
jgi:gluconolactonase